MNDSFISFNMINNLKVIELLVCYNSEIISWVVVNVAMKGLYAWILTVCLVD
jgi:hypothetical protein